MNWLVLVELLLGLVDGTSGFCQYVPENAMGLTQHYVNFGDAAMVIGPTPNGYHWLNCPCFNGIFEDGFLQTSSGDPGLLYSNQVFLVPKRGQVQLSATFSFLDRLMGSCNTTEIINMNENPFFGYGTITAADWTTGWSFGFMLTNYKVYAVYGRNPVPGQPYNTMYNFPFTYLVPVAPRWPSAVSTFSIVLDAGEGSVSYRIDEKEKLFLSSIGGALDGKFLVQRSVPKPNSCPDGFPESFHVILGNGRLVASGLGQEQVCQNAIFNQCTENVANAKGTNCTYLPIPQEPFNRTVLLTSVYRQLSVVQWDDAYNCREQDCRYDCRLPGCPYEPCESSSSESSSTSSGCTVCSSSEPSTESSASACKPIPPADGILRRRRHRRVPSSGDCEQVFGTEFVFNSDWSL